jgi:hypothetical protein
VTDEHTGLDDRAPDGGSDAAVREVLAPLEHLEHAPLSEHAAVFEDAHAGLQRLLAEPEQ